MTDSLSITVYVFASRDVILDWWDAATELDELVL